MALVYVLAIHQAFIDDVVTIMGAHGYEITGSKDIKEAAAPSAVYASIGNRLGTTLDGSLVQNMSFMRRIRNRIIHHGGTPGERLRRDSRAMPHSDAAAWTALVGRPLAAIVADDVIGLRAEDVMGALALSHRMVYAVHDCLAAFMDSCAWARIAIDDCASFGGLGFTDPVRRDRHVRGFIGHYYSGIAFDADDIARALA